MTEITVYGPTGFECLSDRVDIFRHDPGGLNPFYSCNRGTLFNLPEGEYLAKGEVQQLDSKVLYKGNNLPANERKPSVNRLSLEFGDVPQTAIIFRHEGRIVMDWKTKMLPYTQFMYILFHEVAHLYFKTEEYCDTLAENLMLKHGFNPSQITLALPSLIDHERTDKSIKRSKKWIT